jgi:hypothetical protein
MSTFILFPTIHSDIHKLIKRLTGPLLAIAIGIYEIHINGEQVPASIARRKKSDGV